MYRASNILQTARLDKDFTIAEISQKIIIPQKYLEAFENEDKKNFPSEPYCSLMVKDYAVFLGLNGDYILSLFHRDFDVKNKPVNIRRQKFSFTPQFTFGFAIYTGIFLFIAYLVFEYYQFNSPPPLKVNWPELPVTSQEIEISGNTNYDSTVRINGDLVVVKNDGHFSKIIPYPPKDNKIVVEAFSPSNKTSKQDFVFK